MAQGYEPYRYDPRYNPISIKGPPGICGSLSALLAFLCAVAHCGIIRGKSSVDFSYGRGSTSELPTILKLTAMSPFPDTYLVLTAQPTLDEWFRLYSSNTREIEMFAFKWSQRLHSSMSDSRDEGLDKTWWKEDRKASSMLVWTGSTEKSVSLPRQPPPAAHSATPIRKRLRARRRARRAGARMRTSAR